MWSCQNSNKPIFVLYNCKWLTTCNLMWRTLLFCPVVTFISWGLYVKTKIDLLPFVLTMVHLFHVPSCVYHGEGPGGQTANFYFHKEIVILSLKSPTRIPCSLTALTKNKHTYKCWNLSCPHGIFKVCYPPVLCPSVFNSFGRSQLLPDKWPPCINPLLIEIPLVFDANTAFFLPTKLRCQFWL